MLQTPLLAFETLQNSKDLAKLKSMELIEFSFVNSEFLDQGIDSEEKLRLDSWFIFWVNC